MDINYLTGTLLPIREQEIKDGKNLSTRQPIYIVLDLHENFSEGHSEWINNTNLKGKSNEYGYIDNDLDGESREFKLTEGGMEEAMRVTKFYTDKYVAFFLTSQGAHAYLKYQKHNLSSEAYVYVFYSGYGNIEMDLLLKNSKYFINNQGGESRPVLN